MSSRVFHWYESSVDLPLINQNKWYLYLAKAVATGSVPKSAANMIWRSTAGAPSIDIGWNVQYALNWTADVPADGVTVGLNGNWQPANKNEVWDIDENGLWVQGTGPGDANWLTVGNVGYTYPTEPGSTTSVPIHIVVGIQNAATKNFDAIFIDPTMMYLNSHGTYQPQEGVTAWLDSGLVPGQVYRKTGVRNCTVDYATSNAYWATYLMQKGTWVTSASPPAPAAFAPPHSGFNALVEKPATNVIAWPVIARAVMSPPVAASAAAGLLAYLTTQFASFQNVEINLTTTAGKEISFKYGPKKTAVPGTLDFIGVESANYTYPDVVNALESAKGLGKLPVEESWTVTGNEESVATPAAANGTKRSNGAKKTNGANGANGDYYDEEQVEEEDEEKSFAQIPFREMKQHAARMIRA